MAQKESISQAKGQSIDTWLRMLDEYNVRHLALDLQSDRTLVDFFQAHPDWRIDFQDGQAALFVRSVAG
jgi:DNA phosphorothioation-dependent restriction protein DptG